MIIFPAPLSSQVSNVAGTWRQWFEMVYKAVLNLGGLTRIFESSATLDFPSVAAHGVQKLTLTVTGVRVNAASVPRVLVSSIPIDGIIYDGYVSADDVVTIRACNYTAGAIDPASDLFFVSVLVY